MNLVISVETETTRLIHVHSVDPEGLPKIVICIAGQDSKYSITEKEFFDLVRCVHVFARAINIDI